MPFALIFSPFLLSACLLSQPPAGSKPLGPGDPLPRFDLKVAGEANAVLGKENQNLLVVDGGFQLLWGDLKLSGERFTYDPKNERLQAFGKVIVQRGDEVLRGENLTVDGVGGILDIQQASADSPPFFFVGDRIARTPTSLIASNGMITLKEGGSGEVKFRAAQIQLLNSERLILQNATLYLYNKPILRLRHISLPVDVTPQYGGGKTRPTPSPISVRFSRISGTALGLGGRYTLTRDFTGGVLVEASSKQGMQYSLTLAHPLVGPRQEDKSRRLISAPGGRDEETAKARPTTPLRELLTARQPPAPRDPVLDFVDILSTADPLSRPTRTTERNLAAEIALMGNREFSGSRFGPLLLSRLPEVTLTGALPLSPVANMNNNVAARRALHIPRFYLSSDIVAGSYREVRLEEDRAHINHSRTSGAIGVGFNPLLIGERLLLGGEANLRLNHYSAGSTYDYSEASISAAYILATRTMIGGALIQRNVHGDTPFFFDRIDTKNEAQLRGQTAIAGGRYTIAALGRFDATQGKLFDAEFGFAVRGTVLEPRFYYHRLNGSFGFTIAIPGLTTP